MLSHSPQQEVQNIFKAKHPMDTEITKAKVGEVKAHLESESEVEVVLG